MNRYIYDWTRINGYVLKYLQHRWLNGYYGKKIYLLYGASGTGKTCYLKSVFKNNAKDVRKISSADLREMILNKARYHKEPAMPSETIIIVENIEIFLGLTVTCQELFRMLYGWKKSGKLVIGTCSTAEPHDFGWNSKDLSVIPVKSLRITRYVIKRLNEEEGLNLSQQEIVEFSRMSSALDVEGAIQNRRNKRYIMGIMKRRTDTCNKGIS